MYNQVRYEPLNQDPVDNEEEDDDVVFVKDGQANGVTHHSKPTEIQEIHDSLRENIEVDALGLKKGKVSRNKPPADVEVKVLKNGALTRTRVLCFVGTLLACGAVVVTLAFVVPYLRETKIPIIRYNQTEDWRVRMEGVGKNEIDNQFGVNVIATIIGTYVTMVFIIIPSSVSFLQAPNLVCEYLMLTRMVEMTSFLDQQWITF